MPVKQIIVLANSIKKRHRCVAGRELIVNRAGRESWGAWIRPVTDHDEGAITISECRLTDNTIPLPFDVIQVPLTAAENNITQPENWYIKQSTQWRKISTLSNNEAQKLIETPKDLWLEPGVKQDRVTSKFLLARKSHQSLYLIRPVHFHFSVEISAWDGIRKKQLRAVFNYNGKPYNFSMTDPLISQKYFRNFGQVNSGEVELEPNDDLLICVSLTPEFNGHHYKIVATVIEVYQCNDLESSESLYTS